MPKSHIRLFELEIRKNKTLAEELFLTADRRVFLAKYVYLAKEHGFVISASEAEAAGILKKRERQFHSQDPLVEEIDKMFRTSGGHSTDFNG